MKKILLVEQDVLLAKQYRKKLGQKHSVLYAKDAQLAIEMLDDKELEVDLVIMDINISTNNGVELLHELRSYDDWIDIPVVLLSSVMESKLTPLKLERYGVKKVLYKPATSPSNLLVYAGRAMAA